MKAKKIPHELQGVLWSADVKSLDLDKDRGYIIHQIFSYGTLDEIKWLFSAYSKNEIIKTFISVPYKDYFPARFNFVKNIILKLKDQYLDPRLYVKNIPRYGFNCQHCGR